MSWTDRPAEQRALLNPAFVGVLLSDASRGHVEETETGMPFMLAFLAVPVVLHARTGELIPGTIATSVPAFLIQHPEVRVLLPPVAVELVSSVREGIRFAALHNAVTFGARGELLPRRLKRAPNGINTEDFSACRRRARFVGRWFARAGDPVTLLASWGLRP